MKRQFVLILAALGLLGSCGSQPPPVTEPAARFEYFVRKEVGALHDVKSVTARKQESSASWSVNVRFVPNFSTSWDLERIMESIEFKVMDAFHGIYSAGLEVHFAVVIGYVSVVDNMGNSSEVRAYRAKMPPEIAKRINWENRLQVSPRKLGLVDYIHPALRN